MQLIDLPIQFIIPAQWNPNTMTAALLQKLKESLGRYDVVQPLVVRPLGNEAYEIIAGNQRFQVMKELGYTMVPCIVVELGERQAKLLSLVLSDLHGEHDLGLKGQLLNDILEELSQEQIISLLPETAESLSALTSLGQGNMATYLANWQQAQAVRLKHMTFQFQENELPVVEEALTEAIEQVKEHPKGPNLRGQALVSICQFYLKHRSIV